MTALAHLSTHTETADFETVTPALAEAYLRKNKRNRPLYKTYVAQLVRDLENGRFKVIGQGVGFDWNDDLIDGQHRLTAIVQSGISARMLVVRGLDPSSQDVTDIGKKRTAADALYLEGLAKARPGQLASIARSVLLIENAPSNDPRLRPTQAEVLAKVRAEQDEFEEAAYVLGKSYTAGLRGGMIYGVAYYYLAAKNPDAAHDFFDKLLTGANLAPGDPIYALRRRLMKEPPRSNSATLLRTNVALFAKAWNLWRAGRKAEYIRIGRSEKLPEPVA